MYLVDTNVVIEFLGATLPPKSSKWIQHIVNQNQHHLSIINQMELLGYNGNPSEMQIIEAFVNTSKLLSITQPIVLKTIEIRKAHSIKLPDAIIAATAIIHNLELLTRNISDFKNIIGLNITDPRTI